VCGTLTISWGFSFSSRGVFPGSAVMDSALSIVIVMMLAVTSCGGAEQDGVSLGAMSLSLMPRPHHQGAYCTVLRCWTFCVSTC
jgi:hypothetical protein